MKGAFGMTGRLALAVLTVFVMTISDAGAGQGDPSAAGQLPQSRAGRPAGRGGRLGLPPRAPNPETMTVQQVEQYLDQVVLYQARTRLQLTDDQFYPFGEALRQLQRARRQQQRNRLQVLRDLGALTEVEYADAAAINAKLKELDEATNESARQVNEAMATIDRVLDVTPAGAIPGVRRKHGAPKARPDRARPAAGRQPPFAGPPPPATP